MLSGFSQILDALDWRFEDNILNLKTQNMPLRTGSPITIFLLQRLLHKCQSGGSNSHTRNTDQIWPSKYFQCWWTTFLHQWTKCCQCYQILIYLLVNRWLGVVDYREHFYGISSQTKTCCIQLKFYLVHGNACYFINRMGRNSEKNICIYAVIPRPRDAHLMGECTLFLQGNSGKRHCVHLMIFYFKKIQVRPISQLLTPAVINTH